MGHAMVDERTCYCLPTTEPRAPQVLVNRDAGGQRKTPDHQIHGEHPPRRVPSILRRPQHTHDEDNHKRGEEPCANPPASEAAHGVEDLPSSVSIAPGLAIRECGEGADEGRREVSQALGSKPQYEVDDIYDEHGGGTEPNKYAKEIEQQVCTESAAIEVCLRGEDVGDLFERGLHAEQGG
ncbi:hypothetical protein BU23DRAFT_299983 [Bimuria novae-zelandiae CBS 107.79]|uniref:Uncharacterized protein n=1 Tax=Bimuria novae-zelandiae CBS 107.79 TaxID=1447943 RepID=A0A6A5VJ01_9PLEO|nr:hypothetical protein BU23DRAFT_299983 [Bimuria novae-zelandiae CBS 107.79]